MFAVSSNARPGSNRVARIRLVRAEEGWPHIRGMSPIAYFSLFCQR